MKDPILKKCLLKRVRYARNLEVDRCPSKENLFGQSALSMNATYIIFSLRWSINSWNNY